MKLLNYNQKKHKDKVPCLVGDANSGKTSLFFPIQGLVHHGNIATVTKQRAFNKAMINPSTEVIFIDEATEKTLDIDDWKVLTQGGYTAHDVKYQTARAFINKCPMSITAQHKLDFGPADQPAMERRLRTYNFKHLARTKKTAAAWLKKHAMDCVVWAAEKAKACEGDSESENDDDDDASSETGAGDEESILKAEEKEALRSFTLTSPTADEDTITPSTDEDEPQCTDEIRTSIDVLDVLKEALARSHPESLRHRQVRHMLSEEERKRSVQENFNRQQHLQRIDYLREKGVSTQNAELLPTDPWRATPTPILRDLQKHQEAQRAFQEQQRREKARKAFEGAWLQNTEKELHDCAKRIHTSLDPLMTASLTAYRELLEDKLKNHHRNIGTLGSKEALEERKRVCVAQGLLQSRYQHLVRNVFEERLCHRQRSSVSRRYPTA